jgi:hypothetical protein
LPSTATTAHGPKGVSREQALEPPGEEGCLKGIVDLQAAINRYLAKTNDNPKPFVWTADPDAVIEKVRRGKIALASMG